MNHQFLGASFNAKCVSMTLLIIEEVVTYIFENKAMHVIGLCDQGKKSGILI